MDILLLAVEVTVLIVIFLFLNRITEIIIQKILKLGFVKENNNQVIKLRHNIRIFLLLTCVLLCISILVTGGVLIYQGKSVQKFQLGLILTFSPTPKLWFRFLTGSLKSILLLMLVKYIIPVIHGYLDIASERAQNFDKITNNNESIRIFFNSIKTILTNSLWILAIILCTEFYNLIKDITNTMYFGFKCYLIVSVGLLSAKVISVIIDTSDYLTIKYAKPDNFFLEFYKSLQPLISLLKKCIEYVIYVGTVILIVRDISSLAWMTVFGVKIIMIIGIFFASSVLSKIFNIILEDLVLKSENLTDLQRQRRLTIIPLFKSILKYLIYFSAGISVLTLIGLNPTPILAGAGIIGLAVGFGAQNLINDIVCGFFILFENYYLVGDFIQVSEALGLVEAIDLRTTRIRHPNGQVYIIRNGEIKDVINYSKQYVYAVVEVGVSYESNLVRVYEVLETLGKELQKKNSDVLEITKVEGVEKFEESALIIRTITKVKPGKHLPVERVMRKMIKDAFDREDIQFSDDLDALMLLHHNESRLNSNISKTSQAG
ncbi:MAG TPA: mechanosensitive ion channel family protein [Kamptonema sp.]|nr:mechanosensitive ion channel family protein [Kamptonema sp.]